MQTAENLVLALVNIISLLFVGRTRERRDGVSASHKFGAPYHSESLINIRTYLTNTLEANCLSNIDIRPRMISQQLN